jgi:alanyl-tRNA synthetase
MNDIAAAESKVASIRTRMEGEVLSQASKSILRSSVEKVQKDVFQVKKKLTLSKMQDNIDLAKKTAAALAKSGAKKIVLKLDIGSDSSIIKLATEEIKKAAPGVAFLGVSADEEKLSCFAFVPDELTDTIKANDWVSKTLESCGGKGGGRPGNAQGSGPLSGGKEASISAAIELASSCIQ